MVACFPVPGNQKALSGVFSNSEYSGQPRMIRRSITGAAVLLLLTFGGVADASGGHRGYYGGPRHWQGGHFGYGNRHGRSHFDLGFYFGGPLWGPAYVRPPVYVAPPVYIEQQPPVYIQRPPALWYYCQNPAGYYPYVQSCSQAWIPVDPATVPPR